MTPLTVAARLLCSWDSPARILEWFAVSLLQRIFPTQGSHPGLLHCRQILYHVSYLSMHQLMDLWVVPTSFLAVVKNNALNISEPVCVDMFSFLLK